MNKILTNRRDDNDKGFTLIELMVVVLIIAILLAIAIPTFLGAQTKAKDRGAQSSARNALTAAKTIYADKGTYELATAANLLLGEPSLTFVVGTATTGSSAGPKSVAVLAPATPFKVFYAAVLSDSGTCYYIRDSIDPTDTLPGASYASAADKTATSCFVNVGATYVTTGW
jgi:type IV pilus assembly protein PilA